MPTPVEVVAGRQAVPEDFKPSGIGHDAKTEEAETPLASDAGTSNDS